MLVIGFLMLAKMPNTIWASLAYFSFTPLPRGLRIRTHFYFTVRFIVLHVAARSITDLPEPERLLREMWFGRRAADCSAPVRQFLWFLTIGVRSSILHRLGGSVGMTAIIQIPGSPYAASSRLLFFVSIPMGIYRARCIPGGRNNLRSESELQTGGSGRSVF